ncbi:MAG: T9SS type A sorting domain-containing protein [Saprospiraceae bacterium]|nr:T9SS type A sorting domain-containing protein [Saprospiraceae bacterium]
MKKISLLSLLILFISISVSIGQEMITYPAGPFTTFFDGELIGADYWSEEPKILSAGLGFCDIVGVPTAALTEEVVRQAGGAWLTDIECDTANAGFFTATSTIQQVGAVYILKTPYGDLKDGALGLDGLPIVFSWPVLTSTIDLTDFQFTLNTGEVVTPLAASSNPNWENNERNCVVVFAEWGNRLPSSDDNARFPVKLEIVEDDTPLTLVGPGGQLFNAVGLTWETDSSPYDENNGPRLVGAKLNYVGEEALGEGVNSSFAEQVLGPVLAANSEFDLYGGGDFRLRMLTTGGFSPDGVRGVLPTDYEKFFRIHVLGENGDTVLIEKDSVDYQVMGGTLRVIGLSDLGAVEGGDVEYGDCYTEDRDNYIDIILVGDTAAARNIIFLEIPSLEVEGYQPFYNPGGPGTTPFPEVTYTQPGPRDLEPVIMALDDPMRVTYNIRPAAEDIDFVSYNTFMLPLLPEGIEYDPNREAFLVSSAVGGAISLIRTDGSFSNLIPPMVFNGNGTFGLQIDTLNNRLLAVAANFMDPTVAWLYRFDLENATLIDSVNLASVPTRPGLPLNFVNDVTVDKEGNAYVTNSDKGVIYKVDSEGQASLFFEDNSFAPPNPLTQTGFNGIEYHEDGYLLVVHSVNDKIYKIMIDNPSEITEVSLPDGSLRSGDGMFLDDDELVVVSNTANGAAEPEDSDPAVPFVTKYMTTDDWSSAVQVGNTYATGDLFPTTVVKVGEDYFINYAYFNFLAYRNNPVNYLISKASFDSNQRNAGSDTTIPRVNTPIVPFSYGADYPEPYYADCSTPIADGVPDLSGDWVETTVTINGEEIAAQPDPRRERIEQCGNRILIASNGVLHEVFQADNTMFNGVNDVDPMGNPLHFTGRFEDNVFLLTPILTDTTQTIPDISRELIQNDGGDEVLKLFNPLLGATPTRYLRKETDIVATRDLILTNDFKVVPNPFQNETLLTWDNLGKDVFQAQLLNVSGQVVRKYRNVSGESLRIEKRDLLPGIYFLNIIDGSGHFGTLKLLMQE